MTSHSKIFGDALKRFATWRKQDNSARVNRIVDTASKRHTETIKRLERKRALDAAEAKRQIDAVNASAAAAKKANAERQKAISDLANKVAKTFKSANSKKFDPKLAAKIKKENLTKRGLLLAPKKAKSEGELRQMAAKQKEAIRKTKNEFTGRQPKRVRMNKEK